MRAKRRPPARPGDLPADEKLSGHVCPFLVDFTPTPGKSQVPVELATKPQWLCWRTEKRGDRDAKVPYAPGAGRQASTTDPRTWRTYDEAVAAAKRGNYDGVGFVFTADDGMTGVDLDNCRDPETGEIEPWALEIVEALDSYTEVSPSGRGLHVFVEAKLPPGGRRRGNVEMYDSARYFTFTAQHLAGTPEAVEPRQSEVDALHVKIFGKSRESGPERPLPATVSIDDAELLRKAQNAANGAKFAKLWAGDASDYASQSEADLALCSLLAFWTSRDAERIDRLFRQSGLYRAKWERQDYRERTIAKAIVGCSDWYTPAGDDGNNTAGKLRALRQHAVSRQWENNRTRETDRLCYLQIVERGIEAGTLDVAMSSRDLSERAGISNKTASKALRRLTDYGLIELVKRSDGFDAPVYRLNMKPKVTLQNNTFFVDGLEADDDPPTVPKGMCYLSLHILSETADDDAFLWASKLRDDKRRENEPDGSLGATARSLIAALSAENGLSIGELAEATGMHRITASKKAKTLAGVGLVRTKKVGRSLIVYLVDNWRTVLDGFRERLTTFGRGLKRKLEHTKQRAAHYSRLLKRLPRDLRDRKSDIRRALAHARERWPALERAVGLIRPPGGYYRRAKEPERQESIQTAPLPANHRWQHQQIAAWRIEGARIDAEVLAA